MRFLMVDRITALESGKLARAVKNVALSEDLFTHHFPDQPLMPGTMLLECMVQVADAIMREASNFESLGLLQHVNRLRLRRIVVPGDQVELEVKQKSSDGQQQCFEAQARVGGTVAASADFVMLSRPLEEFESVADARKLFRFLQPRNALDME
jgi:3-hydroxyacyl-[acyl-carrier-protein] dehydratase